MTDPDWKRLGRYVVARRTEMGFRSRTDFAAAVKVSARLLSDIEKGRRVNFGQVTLSALEAVLGWETGSVQAVVGGGEPQLRAGAQSPQPPRRPAAKSMTADEHEAEAMRLLAESRNGPSDMNASRIARAQVHAILSLRQPRRPFVPGYEALSGAALDDVNPGVHEYPGD